MEQDRSFVDLMARIRAGLKEAPECMTTLPRWLQLLPRQPETQLGRTVEDWAAMPARSAFSYCLFLLGP
jgi:hypothetical protein